VRGSLRSGCAARVVERRAGKPADPLRFPARALGLGQKRPSFGGTVKPDRIAELGWRRAFHRRTWAVLVLWPFGLLLGWAAVACGLPTSYPDDPPRTRFRSRRPKPDVELKRAVGLGRWRPDRSDSEPIEWLAYRGGIHVAVWLLGLLGIVASRWVAMLMQSLVVWAGRFGALCGAAGVGAAVLGGWMMASVSARFFAAARQGGDLELLLTTPIGAKTIISDQWKVLKRLFVWPVLVMQVGLLIPAALGASGTRALRHPT